MTTNRNLIFSAVFQKSICLCEVDLRIRIVAACLRSSLIQYIIWLQFVAEGNAFIEVLFYQIHEGRRSKVGSHNRSTDFEVAIINILDGCNVFLNWNNWSFCEGEVVDVQVGCIVAFKVNINLRNFAGKAELDVGKFCPVAVRSLGCQIAVMPFAGSIGIFQTQLDAVVPFCLCVSTDGVFFVWFADVIQQKLRAVPALGTVGYHHGRRTAVCLAIGDGNRFDTTSSGKR